MKIKVHRFRNGRYEIFLPRSKDSLQLAEVTFDIIKRLSPYDAMRMKFTRRGDEDMVVDRVTHSGFFAGNKQYIWGEVYRREL